MTTCQKVMFYIFGAFVIFKTVIFDLQFYSYIKRYWETYQTLNQVEIWIMLFTAIKITVVVPDYVFNEINWLFWVFIVNSAMTFWLSHILHMRACMVHQSSVCEARAFVAVFAFRIFLIICIIILGPIFDNLSNNEGAEYEYSFRLKCTDDNPYPIRFILIFLLDFISATFDFVVFLLRETTLGEQQRLKEIRVAAIEASVAERRDTTLKNRV